MRPTFDVITSREALELLEQEPQALLIDVRTQEEFNELHAEGALNLALFELVERIGDYAERDHTIILYCQTGRRSNTAAAALAEEGYRKVFDAGGIEDWVGQLTAG